MPNKLHKSKSGFTIIEVVLVLAIAGLIFLMVFLALPALQRSQKDTQRRNDMARFASQVVQYQTNNRGKVPNIAQAAGVYPPSNKTAEETYGSELKNAYSAYNSGNKAPANIEATSGGWTSFLDSYMWAANDDFTDPGGTPYAVQDHGNIADIKLGTLEEDKGNEKIGVAFDSLFVASVYADTDPTTDPTPTPTPTPVSDGKSYTFQIDGVDSLIHVVHGAICGASEGTVEKSSNASARKLAFIYKLEGSGYYCGEV